MKTILILLGLCAFALAVLPTPVVNKKYKISDKVFLEKQLGVLRLFKYVNQPSFYKDFVDIATTFSPEQNYQLWGNPTYVKDFFTLYKTEILQKGQIFSAFYQEHVEQAITLFKLFYYAKDFETFFKTAVWARQYVNEGLFLYSVSVALIHRPDTYGIILPPIYEVYPYYFFPSEVITKVQKIKQVNGSAASTYGHEGIGYKILSNYSGSYLYLNPQQSVLSYFTEDIGLNSFYYYYNLYYPYWLDGKEFNLSKDKRGELYYFVHQQILARYYLESLSNGFGSIPAIKTFAPIATGYFPSLTYPSGLPFPTRPNNIHIVQQWGNQFYANYTDSLTYLEDYARRVRDAIDLGYVYTFSGEKVYLYDPHGFEILGNLIQSNPDSPNSKFYGSLQIYASYILGYSYYPYGKYYLAPSVLEHFETSLRDPVFYQYFKWIVQFFQKYKLNLPYYSYQDLKFPGVKIEGVTIDRLITYFEPFYSDLSAVAYYGEYEFESSFPVQAVQYRLNHKPFTYTLDVYSDKTVESVVKVFIGPKYDEFGDEIDITKNYANFVLIEKFLYNLKSGKNVITRNSKQSFYVSDRTTYQDLYKNVLQAYKGQQEFQIDGSETYWGFPNRFLLPKGHVGGQTYQLYVYIYPATGVPFVDEVVYPRVGTGGYLLDSKPFGYPLDKYVYKPEFFVPNSYFYDIVIYHKKYEDLNTSTGYQI